MRWKVEILKLKLRNSELQRENDTLHGTIREQNNLLTEANRLLMEQTSTKPSRPHYSASERTIIAGKQRYKCCDPFGDCPLGRIPPYDRSFNESGFHLDHVTPFCEAPVGPLRATCVMCHAKKSIQEAQERSRRKHAQSEAGD